MTTLISSTLVHKIRQPAATISEEHPALILLHGRGTNEDDLLELADYLDPRLFIVSARAPFRFDQGSGGYTWYDVQDVVTPHPKEFEEIALPIYSLFLPFTIIKSHKFRGSICMAIFDEIFFCH